jgi:iron complex outermembrane receptor protein
MLQIGLKYFLCVFFVLGFTKLAYADCQAEVRGALHNHSHEAIAGVTIKIQELGITTISDEKGAYKFTKICAGNYTFVYEALGYQTLVREIWVGESGIVAHDFALEEGVIHLEETVVKAEKLSDTKQESLTEEKLHTEILQRQQGKTLGELLQNITGVQTLQTGANVQKPILHGLTGIRLPILQNGVRLESQQWGNDHAPEIDAQGIQKVSVVKGASAIRYGAEAMGGVILTDYNALPTTPTLRIRGGTSVGNNPAGFTTNALIELGNRHGIGFRGQASSKYVGDAKAPNYALSNTGARELNFSTAFGIKQNTWQGEISTSYFRTTIGVLRSAHIGNLSDLREALTRNEPWYIAEPTFEIQNPRQAVQHSLTKIQFTKHLSDHIQWQTKYAFQWNDRQEYDIRRGNFANRPAMSLQLFTNSLESLLEYNVGEHWENTTGMQLTYQLNDNKSGTGNAPLVPNYNAEQAGIFSIHRFRQDRYSIELGIRADYKQMQVRRDTILDSQNIRLHHNYSFSNLNATLGFTYKMTEKWNIKTNIGSAWRPPHAIELFARGLHHGAGSIEQGNQNLAPEKAWKALTTLEKVGKTYLSFTAYFHQFANFLYLKPAPEGVRYTIRGAFPVFAYTQTQARFMGTDLNLKTPFKIASLPLAYHLQASAVWAKDTYNQTDLIGVPPISIRQGVGYEANHLKKFDNVYAQLQVQWTLRQMNAPRGLSEEEITGLTNLTWQPSLTDNYDFAPSPAGFALLNFRTGGEFSIQSNASNRFAVHIEGNNLLNTRYRSYLNRLHYYADEVGRNITLRLQYFFK